jgi:hypothetical protein
MALEISDALIRLLGRANTPSMRSFVGSVIQCERLGVSTGTIMRKLAEEMRKRWRKAAEERAQKAPIKILFPLVLLIFPTIFIVCYRRPSSRCRAHSPEAAPPAGAEERLDRPGNPARVQRAVASTRPSCWASRHRPGSQRRRLDAPWARTSCQRASAGYAHALTAAEEKRRYSVSALALHTATSRHAAYVLAHTLTGGAFTCVVLGRPGRICPRWHWSSACVFWRHRSCSCITSPC